MIVKRRIVLDTETTGLSHATGDRIIEIGCVELINNVITNNVFHTFLKTDKIISKSAYSIHGISNNFLRDKPKFGDIQRDFINFIKDDVIILHNASFDIGFLNNELRTIGKQEISNSRVIDTLTMARKMFPGGKVSLDALCRKFKIDLQSRSRHGALIDAKLLALVYIEMSCNKQSSFGF